MFRCEQCGKMTDIGESQNKKTVETREKTYKDKNDAVTGTGLEIVKEINICEKCWEKENKDT